MTAIRAELAAIEPARTCCRLAERAGLGSAALGRARSPVIARLAVRLGGETAASAGPFDWNAARDHDRTAWLRGLFLARGSLSLGQGRSHLELVVEPEDGEELVRRLGEMGLAASWRLRRGRAVVTFKSADRIVAFLRSVGAGSSALELESRLVTRTLRGHLNRVLNAETANVARSVASASRQVEEIEWLEERGALAGMSPLVRDVARLRRASPEATYAELAAELGVSRARVQRAMQQLEAASSAMR